jgi:arylsulfatase A-like enzyme
MVADGRYKLVLRESEAPLLYDLANDPWETTDVAASHPDLVGELSERIEANESGEDTGTVTSR